MPVVLHRVVGLQVNVGVEERATQLGRDGFRVRFEFADDVGAVDVVGVEERAGAGEDAGIVVRVSVVGGHCEKEGEKRREGWCSLQYHG